jgi:hypothetical protein
MRDELILTELIEQGVLKIWEIKARLITRL